MLRLNKFCQPPGGVGGRKGGMRKRGGFILTGVWCRRLADQPYVTCQARDNLEGWQADLKGKSHQTNRCSYPQVVFFKKQTNKQTHNRRLVPLVIEKKKVESHSLVTESLQLYVRTRVLRSGVSYTFQRRPLVHVLCSSRAEAPHLFTPSSALQSSP